MIGKKIQCKNKMSSVGQLFIWMIDKENFDFEERKKKTQIKYITNKIDLVLFNWNIFACSSNIVSISNGNMDGDDPLKRLAWLNFNIVSIII